MNKTLSLYLLIHIPIVNTSKEQSRPNGPDQQRHQERKAKGRVLTAVEDIKDPPKDDARMLDLAVEATQYLEGSLGETTVDANRKNLRSCRGVPVLTTGSAHARHPIDMSGNLSAHI